MIVLIFAGFAWADDTEFIVKPGSIGTGYEPVNTLSPDLTITKVTGGIYALQFSTSASSGGPAVLRVTPYFYTVDPTSTEKQYGIDGPSGVTFRGEFSDFNSAYSPYLLIAQGGNVWKFELNAPAGSGSAWKNSDVFLELGGSELVSGPGGSPDWTQPYQLGVHLHFNGTASYPDYTPRTAIIHKFWVHLPGGDGEDNPGGPGGPGGDGGSGGDGGTDGPPNKNPGDNPNDDPPEEMEPPDDGEPGDPPSTGVPCIDELLNMFKSKFPNFDQELTGGNDFWKVEWQFKIADTDQTFFWSTKPDSSWAVGEALDKLRKWVRSFGILLMVFFAFRQIVITLRQW